VGESEVPPLLTPLSSPQAGARGNLSPAAFNGITTLLVANGAQLAQELLLAIAGLVPPARVRFLSPVLKGLVLVDYAASRSWLEAAVQALPPGGHMDGATLLQAIYSAEALARDDRGAGDRVFGQAAEAPRAGGARGSASERGP